MNTHNYEIYLSDDALNPIWEELNSHKVVVFLNPDHKRASQNQKKLFYGSDSVYEYHFDTNKNAEQLSSI